MNTKDSNLHRRDLIKAATALGIGGVVALGTIAPDAHATTRAHTNQVNFDITTSWTIGTTVPGQIALNPFPVYNNGNVLAITGEIYYNRSDSSQLGDSLKGFIIISTGAIMFVRYVNHGTDILQLWQGAFVGDIGNSNMYGVFQQIYTNDFSIDITNVHPWTATNPLPGQY